MDGIILWTHSISSVSFQKRELKLLGPWISSSLENIAITVIDSLCDLWGDELANPPGYVVPY